VLIGAANVLPSLKERAEGAAGEILTFTDADALRALEVITKRKPAVVAVERVFAGTPRGAALINRIKSDPSLLGSEIRVVSHDDKDAWAGPRRSSEAARGNGTTPVASAHTATSPQPLDQRGTRRSPRFLMTGEMEVLVDGNQAVLVNLSTHGAQLVSATVLKPGQRVRMAVLVEHRQVHHPIAVNLAHDRRLLRGAPMGAIPNNPPYRRNNHHSPPAFAIHVA